MRILNITNRIPYPAVTGAPLRTYNLLRRIASKHEVFLAAFAENHEEMEGARFLRGICREVIAPDPGRRCSLPRLLRAIAYAWHGAPAELALSYSPEMTGQLRRLAMQMKFDAVVIEHGIMGDYLNTLRQEQRKQAAWMLHDIDYKKFERICRTQRNPLRSARLRVHSVMMKNWMPEFASRFGVCITMSEADCKLLAAANDRLKVAVSPNGVDTTQCRLLPEPGRSKALLLVGNMEYGPNSDAAIYFCREVLPIVRHKLGRVQVLIVGPNPPSEVRKLECEFVRVTGRVAELAPYYEACAASIVPLRAGSGTRLKILESLAFGRPVISTSIGCEGLDVIHNEHLLIADTSATFATNVVAVLQDRSLRNRLVENGRRLVVAKYDWDVIASQLLGVLEGIRN